MPQPSGAPFVAETLQRQKQRIASLERSLYLLATDARARMVSCTCHPPPTRHEIDNVESAEALLAGYELQER